MNDQEAGTYSKAEAFSRHRSRETDRPWLKSYIDEHANRHVDHQKLKREHDAYVGHVCGMRGYNGMIDPPCPGCEATHQELKA